MRNSSLTLAAMAALFTAGVCTSAVAQNAIPWSDDFESYANGIQLYHVGGWTGWDDNIAAAGYVSNAQAHAGSNSVDINGPDDTIMQWTNADTPGTYDFKIWQYIPASFSGTTYVIMLNTYNYLNNPADNWSIQLHFDSATGLMTEDFTLETMPYITDQWVPIEVQIDLCNDTQTLLYNGTPLYTDNSWTNGQGSNGQLAIQCLDLYANNANSVFYDDISLEKTGECGGGYEASTSGTCPGQVTVNWSGAEPNAQQGLVFAKGTGNFTIPSGKPCAGTVLGLNSQGIMLVDPPGFIGTGPSGEGQISGNAGQAACGGYVQWVTGGSCATSSVAQLP